jgi:hypothetical protein
LGLTLKIKRGRYSYNHTQEVSGPGFCLFISPLLMSFSSKITSWRIILSHNKLLLIDLESMIFDMDVDASANSSILSPAMDGPFKNGLRGSSYFTSH